MGNSIKIIHKSGWGLPNCLSIIKENSALKWKCLGCAGHFSLFFSGLPLIWGYTWNFHFWVRRISLWPLILLADRLGGSGCAPRQKNQKTWFHFPTTFLAHWFLWDFGQITGPLDYRILKMIIMSVITDHFFFAGGELHGWSKYLRAFITIWKKAFFVQMWFPPLDFLIGFPTYFFALLKYKTVGVMALNIFSMYKQSLT